MEPFSHSSCIDNLLFEEDSQHHYVLPKSATTKPASNNNAMEMSVRLADQVRKSEDAFKSMQAREQAKSAMLKQCLIISLAREPPQAVEFILSICNSELSSEQVKHEVRCFQELLHNSAVERERKSHGLEEQREIVGQLELQLDQTKRTIAALQQDKAALQLQLDAQAEAFDKQLRGYVEERRAVQTEVEAQVSQFRRQLEDKASEVERILQTRLEQEQKQWQTRVLELEQLLHRERQSNRAVQAEDEIKHAVSVAVEDRQAEIRRLRRRLSETAESRRPENELLELARVQAKREQVVDFQLQSRVLELEQKLRESRTEVSAAKYEYLRHTVYSLLTLPLLSQKHTLIPVLAMLLDFSPAELRECEITASREEASEGILGAITNTMYSFTTTAAAIPDVPNKSLIRRHQYVPVPQIE
ncbi:hypothetical protein BASA81_006215 [Batrachochytrium salamandrivorans]|nr:hypothetical protein BASA81_006215 [Batrachochytrium salamandrivorans]